MSKHSLNIAYQYGEKLKSFKNQSQAEKYFYAYRSILLKKCEFLSKHYSYFSPDYTVESLKGLEKWYFHLYDNNTFDNLGVDRREFENMMSVYYGEVVIKNNDNTKWSVVAYPFGQEKYELMVGRNTLMISIVGMCKDWYDRPNNKRHHLLFRNYNFYFNQ